MSDADGAAPRDPASPDQATPTAGMLDDDSLDQVGLADGMAKKTCPVVGIGASAGGIDALRRLFPHVELGRPNGGCPDGRRPDGGPPDGSRPEGDQTNGYRQDRGMAFVVVLHLDPDRASILSEIIARCTDLPVTPVERETAVEPGHVYVISPNTVLTIEDGRLIPERRTPPRGHRNPIDEFLISLAADQGENAACVILSGTGSDGTLGLRAIKEHGGLILAQAGAEYDGMMRSAVATGLVDFILPVEDIPGTLDDYFGRVTRHQDWVRLDGDGGGEAGYAEYLTQITALLRTQTGHDFSKYKDRTIVRRIQRRMYVLQIGTMAAFVERLRHDQEQVNLLFQDLLIGVTQFFRDPDAFAALQREVVPELLRNRGPDDTIRVWVPGCATGEEAYSIAILLREAVPQPHRAPKMQIFASDIDDQALNVARSGRYPTTISKDVSPERLARFFIQEDGTYRIINEIRESCLFSPHNLLRDAPFSRLDLISCRNLLIYLNGDLQDRLIPLFHYALSPGGMLFLGTSENVTKHSRLFMTLNKTHRIFQRRALLERRVPEFPLTAPDAARRTQLTPVRRVAAADTSLRSEAERTLLDRFAPSYVVINADGDVLHSSGHTGKYLELPPGAPDTNIFNMARPGLKLDMRAALHSAAASKQPVVQRKVSIGTDGGSQEIDLYIQPLRFEQASEQFYMVVFQDLGAIMPAVEIDIHAAGEENVRQLEAELRLTRERLQTTTEELESSNEELKSSNEELQSINEELQSANEELETSKEELQSINEELQTVNSELSARVEELSRANNDMSNLLESTQIATVFLDRSLHVKSFTPAAKDVFWLVESDAGRPIMHVRSRLENDALQVDAERVLRSLTTIERPIKSTEGDTRYMMRLLPYRTADNVISGVVMTFTDITRISVAEARIGTLTEDLRARVADLEAILDLVPVGVMIAEGSGEQAVLINTYGAGLLGGEAAHTGLKPMGTAFRLFTGDDAADGEQPLADDQHPIELARRGKAVVDWQGRLVNEQNHAIHVMISATPLLTEAGGVRGAVAAMVDITRHKQAAAQQQFLLGELQHRVKNILATISSLAARMARSRGSVEEFSAAFLSRLGAMGRTHDLLSGGVQRGARLDALVGTALEPYATRDRGNIRLDGPEVTMAANPAATLGMVLHELATNAAKYGALSHADGHVEVSWRILAETSQLQIVWLEQGGPAVDPAGTAGFGTHFISRGVAYELSGTAELELAPGGLRCCIVVPLASNVELAAGSAGDA